MTPEPKIRAAADAVLGVTDRILQSRNRDRGAAVVLGMAVAAYVGLTLYLTRGATFTFDELTWLIDAGRGFDPESILSPHNGHLIAVTRLLFAGTLETVGPEHVVVELFTILNVAATAVLLFVWLRRRIGSVAAVFPAVLVLFLGSTPVVVAPSVTVFAQSTALGLGAFLLLDRGDRRGDIGASVLLLLGLASFSLGLPFAFGAAVLIAFRPGALRRAWIVLVPLVIYGIWFLWARKFHQSTGEIENILLLPGFAADSMAAAASVLSGLAREISEGSTGMIALGWGRVLAVVAVALLFWRGMRTGVSALAWALGAVLLAYWTLGSIGLAELRTPQTDRYAFPAAVLLILIAAEIFRSPTTSRRAVIGLAVAFAFALPGNLFEMRQAGAAIRLGSDNARASLAMLELERDHVDPSFAGSVGLLIPVGAGQYLDIADRFGSIAFPLADLPSQPADVRGQADVALERILNPSLDESSAQEAKGRACEDPVAQEDGAQFELPPGGVALTSERAAAVSMRRFGDDYTIDAGTLGPGRTATLEVPEDASSQPWRVALTGPAPVEVCALVAGSGE